MKIKAGKTQSFKYVMSTYQKGKAYYYYRRNNQRIPIRADFGTADFYRIYAGIHAGFDVNEVSIGEMDRIFKKYLSSVKFNNLASATKKEYKVTITKLAEMFGQRGANSIKKREILEWVDFLKENTTERKGKRYFTVFRLVLNWAYSRDLVKKNPIDGVVWVKGEVNPYPPWLQDEIDLIIPSLDGDCRTAFMLALHTGQRIGDVLKMRWDDIQDGYIRVEQAKTRQDLQIPIVSALNDVLGKLARDNKAKIINSSYRAVAFALREACNKLKIENRSFHGLRKNSAISLLEAGCSGDEIKAITGHTTDAMLQHYTAKRNQKLLAESATKKLAKQRAKM